MINHLSDIPFFLHNFERRIHPHFVLYLIDFASSPYREMDTRSYNDHMEEACWNPERHTALRRIEQTLFSRLHKAFCTFAPAQHVFKLHQVNHPLCLSKLWFSLLDTFVPQIELVHSLCAGKVWISLLSSSITPPLTGRGRGSTNPSNMHRNGDKETQMRANPPKSKVPADTIQRSGNKKRVPSALGLPPVGHWPKADLPLDVRGLRIERLAPIHFIMVSRAPAHLLYRTGWCNTQTQGHQDK